MFHRTSFLVVFVLAVLSLPVSAAPPSLSTIEFFEKEVRPLLVERCQKCHGDEKPKGGLKLTGRAGILQGGETGPAALAGKPDESLFIQAIRYKATLRMPPKAKLSEKEIATLTRWVQLGLPWPEAQPGSAAAKKGQVFQITEEQRRFWSFQPVKAFPPPSVKDAAWPRSDIDRFILAGLEARGLKPAAVADKRTLLRRATFDLTGLPPTPEEIDAFLADQSPDAFARVVDRLLTSPRYGERWGRHWLDVVRYADSRDSRGIGAADDITDAWRYRDWVVNAFNRDLPYDQFILQQIAGDLLPASQPGKVNAEGLVATGLLTIGEWGTGDADKDKMMTDIVDDQIDVVGRAFMGLTLACARCHDHKFDPIGTEDYYALAGIFFSTHILPAPGAKTDGSPMLRTPLLSQEEIAKAKLDHHRKAVDLEKRLVAATGTHYAAFARGLVPQTADYLKASLEYQSRPASQAGLSLGQFATARKLHEYALRQWLSYLNQGDYRLMTKPVRDMAGRPGVHVWKGEPDCPWLTVNTNDKEVQIGTYKLPPRSVAVHPGPKNGVVIGWRSPIDGTVQITGRVIDADPVGGDGIAWAIDISRVGRTRELASGDIPNGGAQLFSQGKKAPSRNAVEVRTGDMIHLVVLPKAEYSFDSTTVELVIRKSDGSATWDLTRDIVGDLHQGGKGNPHSDSLGNPAVWHFYDMADVDRAKKLLGRPTTLLANWQRTAEGVAEGEIDRSEIDQVAQKTQQSLQLGDKGPGADLYQELISPQGPYWLTPQEEAKHLPAPARAELARLRAELEALKKGPVLPLTLAAQEGGVPGSVHAGIHDARIHIRGSYQRLGDPVPRRFPRIVAGDNQTPITKGSGRRELADWLIRAEHPLTARVMANRIWQYHFGEGIVRTPSNFGKLGVPPTHPKLLDTLARQFIASGWSVKAMHRAIMLSASYQQSSEPPTETLRLDPDNRLFGRMNRKRLEAEAIRDNLLAVSAKLDLSMGGPSIRDFGNHRRTLYLMTIRSDRSSFGPLFDAADATAMVDKRTVSTVAPQALFLLNHPFVLEQAQALANRIGECNLADDQQRIRRLYAVLYGRPATAEEIDIGEAVLRRARGVNTLLAAWEEYCQVLLCANEFIYVD